MMMGMHTILLRLRQTLRSFRSASRGNVVITFALAAIPIIGAVGAAVDYSRANSVKANLQAALDSVALMLSKEAAADSNNQLQINASKYFLALFNPPEANNFKISVTYTSGGGSNLVVNGSATVPTTFAAVLGLDKIDVTSTSTVKWGNSRLRVALVLDNTGSMANSGKMAALQTATKNLLSQLSSAAQTNGDVYVSIVPFNKDINVDSKNKGKNWIDWTDWDAKNGTCTDAVSVNESSCTTNGFKWKSNNHNTWNGCVADRGDPTAPNPGNYDTNVVAPNNKDLATQFSAEQLDPCPQAEMDLSYDWPSMNALVDAMSPGGNTNQAIGLAAGWMSLVGGGPFPKPPKMAKKYEYSQIIILLTDGRNTEDRWYSSQASIDARQQMTCDNVKAAGIILYTIQVNTGGDPTSALLQNCASSSDKFFLLTSANEIVTTFASIGTNLTKLYVAK